MRYSEISSPGITASKVESWANQVKKDCNLKHFHVYLTARNEIKLFTIIAGENGQGRGTAAMEKLCAFADEYGLRVTLTPGTKDDNHGTTSRARLVRFYKRFGFKENKGRSIDFSVSDGMIREPQSSHSIT